MFGVNDSAAVVVHGPHFVEPTPGRFAHALNTSALSSTRRPVAACRRRRTRTIVAGRCVDDGIRDDCYARKKGRGGQQEKRGSHLVVTMAIGSERFPRQ